MSFAKEAFRLVTQSLLSLLMTSSNIIRHLMTELTPGQEKVMVCLDPRSVGITYHNNAEYGVMIPAVRPVLNERDKRVKEEHIISAMTLGIWNLHQHVAFGISGT